MREILFRGKRKDNGEWVYGDLIHRKIWSSELYIIRVEDNGFDSYVEYEVTPETIGQDTGLTDKNGKKIFEGDVVNVNTKKDELCHRYEGRNLVIQFDEFHRFIANGRLAYPLCNHYEWEVIGNIHGNPELLKGGGADGL